MFGRRVFRILATLATSGPRKWTGSGWQVGEGDDLKQRLRQATGIAAPRRAVGRL